jgi:hypothetical protein
MNRFPIRVVMRAALSLLLVGCLTMPFLLSGCDNGEPPLLPLPPEYLIIGMAVLQPGVYFSGNIYPINGQANDIDTVLFGDSMCTVGKSGGWVEGNGFSYGFTYQNFADSSRLHSGDTIDIFFVRETHERAFVGLKLVVYPQDSIQMVAPTQNSSVPLNTDLEIVWHKVDHADWYSVYYTYDTSSVFASPMTQVYDFATDTSYVVPGSQLPDNGDFRIFVSAVTGPIPGNGGNVQSSSMTGAIYSWAEPPIRYGWRLSIGTGLPPTLQQQVKEYQPGPLTRYLHVK